MNNRKDLKTAISTLNVSKPLRTGSQMHSISDQFEPPSRKSEVKLNSDQFDLRSVTSQIEKYDFVEKSEGVFQIPHKIFEWVHKVIDTKVELLVFNCLLRYTLGFQRTRCEASQSYISKWTGIAPPNVRRALRELQEKGHVKRVEAGTTQHEAAVYEIPIVAAYFEFLERKKSQIKKDSDQNDPGSNRTQMCDQNNLSSEINLISKKDIKKTNSNKPLSSQVLNNYLNQIFAPKKKESESSFLEILLGKFSETEVEECLLFIKKHGDLKSREVVHSPMAYLASCIDDVKRILKGTREKGTSEERAQQEKMAADLKAKYEYQKKESAFLNAFPDVETQRKVIEKLSKIHGGGIPLKESVARSVAIQEWWDGLSNSEQNYLAKEAL